MLSTKSSAQATNDQLRTGLPRSHSLLFLSDDLLRLLFQSKLLEVDIMHSLSIRDLLDKALDRVQRRQPARTQQSVILAFLHFGVIAIALSSLLIAVVWIYEAYVFRCGGWVVG